MYNAAKYDLIHTDSIVWKENYTYANTTTPPIVAATVLTAVSNNDMDPLILSSKHK